MASPELAAAVDGLLELERGGAAPGALAEARAALEGQYAEAARRVGGELRAVAGEPRFREALAWQNRQALGRGVGSLLRTAPGATDSRTRQNERLVATYLQRYCVKNDTIGFFGPLVWGRLGPAGEAVEARPGPELEAHRRVCFEYWAVAALAQALARAPALEPWLFPRLLPLARLEGNVLHTPFGPEELPPLAAQVLAACTGERAARDIAAGLGGWEQVRPLLADFAAREVISWTLELPTVGLPEAHLRQRLGRVGDAAAREAALAALEELERARERAARSRGEEALDRTLELDACFTRLTGQAASRKAGQLFAGRTPVFLDCRRGVELALGPALGAELARPLSLLLQGARWLSFEVARRYLEALSALFRSLAQEGGEERIELLRFWPAAARLFPRAGGEAPEPVRAVSREYQRRWAEVLGLDPEQRRMELSPDRLEPRVREAFSAPCPGWPGARNHSPDLQLAAADLEAIRRGDYLLVLGELHLTANTLEQELFFREHPDPEALERALRADFPRGRFAPAVPADEAGRNYITVLSRHPLDATVEYDAIPSWRPREQTFAISELVVEEREGRLEVATRDGRRRWDLLEVLDVLLTEINVPLLPDSPHLPRIQLGRLVVQRELWRFPSAGLEFAAARSPLERLVGARRWAERHGLPRHLFFTAAGQKPCFLDLASPVLVEHFAKLARASAEVTLTEMLPSLDQCWLEDAAGRRYTSELRLVAVDPEPWRPAAR